MADYQLECVVVDSTLGCSRACEWRVAISERYQETVTAQHRASLSPLMVTSAMISTSELKPLIYHTCSPGVMASWCTSHEVHERDN